MENFFSIGDLIIYDRVPAVIVGEREDTSWHNVASVIVEYPTLEMKNKVYRFVGFFVGMRLSSRQLLLHCEQVIKGIQKGEFQHKKVRKDDINFTR